MKSAQTSRRPKPKLEVIWDEPSHRGPGARFSPLGMLCFFGFAAATRCRRFLLSKEQNQLHVSGIWSSSPFHAKAAFSRSRRIAENARPYLHSGERETEISGD